MLCFVTGIVMPVMSASWNASLPTTGRRDLAGDGDHGDRVHLRVGERGDQVAAAGAGRGHGDAHLAGRPRVSLGGVAGPLLVAAQHVPHAGVEQRVVGRQDRAAGDAEDDVDALALERLEQRLRAGDLHLAATSSVRASTGPVSTRFTVADRRCDRFRHARSNSHGVQSRRRICRTSSPLLVAEVEAGAEVHHFRGQVAVDDGADRGVLGLDADLAGPLPQHAGDDVPVSLELVPHVLLLLSDRSRSVPLAVAWSRRGTKNPSRGEGYRRGHGPRGPSRAYRISTRTLRSNSLLVDMVQPVYGRERACQPADG